MSRSNRLKVGETVFTVTYLGSDDCRALRGQDITEPVVKMFIYGDSRELAEPPRCVELDVGQKNVTLTELCQKKNKVEKRRLMSMATRDVTYAALGFPPNNDLLVAIVLGQHAKPKYVVRAHVFKCDTTDMAAKIVALLMATATSVPCKAYVSKVEDDLVRRKLVEPSVDLSLYPLATTHVHRASANATNRTSRLIETTSNTAHTHNDGLYQKQSADVAHQSKTPAAAKTFGGEPLVDYSDEEGKEEAGTLKQKQAPRDTNNNAGAGGVRSSGVIKDGGDDDYVFDAMESIKVLDDVLMQVPQSRESIMYDNVANELRRKLGKDRGQGQGQVGNKASPENNGGPLLLPPKDYDTAHRQQGKLHNIDERRSRNAVIVGDSKATTAIWQPEVTPAAASRSKLPQTTTANTTASTTRGSQQPAVTGGGFAPALAHVTADSDFMEKTASSSSPSQMMASDERQTQQTDAPLARSSPPYARQIAGDGITPMPTSAAGWRRLADSSDGPVMNLRAAYRGGGGGGGGGGRGDDNVTITTKSPPHHRNNINPLPSNKDATVMPTVQQTAEPGFTRQTSNSPGNNNRTNGNVSRITVMDINYNSNNGNIHRTTNGKNIANDRFAVPNYSHMNASRDSNYHSNTSEDDKHDSLELQRHLDGSLSPDSQPSSGEFHLPRVQNRSYASKPSSSAVYNSASAAATSSRDDLAGKTRSRMLAPVDDRDRRKEAWDDRDRNKGPVDDRDRGRVPIDDRNRNRDPIDDRDGGRVPTGDKSRDLTDDRGRGITDNRGLKDERNRFQQGVYGGSGYRW